MIFNLSNSQLTKIINIKNDFKDNLSLIILLPTLLGGVYQAIELIIISPSLIRFFSISQLIADGLFILVYFVVILVMPYFAAYIILDLILKKHPKSLKILATIIFLLFIALGLFLEVKQDFIERDNMLGFVVEIVLGLISVSVFNVIIRFFNNSQNNYTEWLRLYFAANLILSSLILSLTMYHRMSESIPIDNFEILKKKYNDKEKVKILYYNDKYIFLQIENSLKENNIHIEKIESILETR